MALFSWNARHRYMYSRFAALMVLVLLAVDPAIADEERPNGTNCDLNAPPQSAGEEVNRGVTLRIFPRTKDIGPNYSGCQSLWAPDRNGWALVSMVEIVGGDPIRIWGPPGVGEPKMMACRFKGGQIVRGDPATCPMPEFLILKSLAPGCAARIGEAVGKRGIAAAPPAGCDYE